MSEAAESLIDDTPTSEVSDTGESVTNESEAPAGPSWFLAENMPGDGDRPEWFKDKYKSVADQAKAYADLEKRFGGFTGAPESYELTLPEGVEGQFDMEDPRLAAFQEAARESNMSQETFTKFLHQYIEGEVAGETINVEAELKALGPNAQSRLASLRDWGKANLDDAQFQAMRVLASTAEGVGVLEAMISKTREAKMPTGNEVVKTGPSEQELQEMVADPRYQSSAAYRKEVERKFEEFYGKQPYQNVVQ